MEKRNHTGGDPIFAFGSHAVGRKTIRLGKYNFLETSTGTLFWMVFSQLACQANQQIPDS